MPNKNSRLAATLLAAGTIALVTACAPGDPLRTVNPALIGDGSSIPPSKQRALAPAPTPALETVGVPTAPSFGPGVGAELNSGIGIQRDNALVP